MRGVCRRGCCGHGDKNWITFRQFHTQKYIFILRNTPSDARHHHPGRASQCRAPIALSVRRGGGCAGVLGARERVFMRRSRRGRVHKFSWPAGEGAQILQCSPAPDRAGSRLLGCKTKSDTFSIFACHPCAGAMLIFSVSFQFLRMTPKSSEAKAAGARLWRGGATMGALWAGSPSPSG